MVGARLRIPDRVAHLIRGLHPDIKRKVRAGLEAIIADPNIGKALKEELSGLRSYRIGRFRIVYRSAPEQGIEIVAVGPRSHIYQETYRLLRRRRESQ